MAVLGIWLIASAIFGAIGLLLPWFHPDDPATHVVGTWHSWDSAWICFVLIGVLLYTGAAGLVLVNEFAGRVQSSAHNVAAMLDRMLWIPAVGIAALIFQAWNLPNDYVVCPAYMDASTCGLTGTSAWIHDPGATRGIQFGWWLSLIACCAALLCCGLLFFRRDELANTIISHRFSESEEPEPRTASAQRTAERTAIRAAHSTSRRGGPDGSRTCTNDECELYGWPTDDEACNECAQETVAVDTSRAPGRSLAYFGLVEPQTQHTGEWMCPSPACDKGGLRTETPFCDTCGQTTVRFE